MKGTVAVRRGVTLSGSGSELKVTGTLINETGSDLHSVYFAFVDDFNPERPWRELLWHLPDAFEKAAWPSGASIDLAELMGGLDTVPPSGQARKPGVRGDRGYINQQWAANVFSPDLKGRDSGRYENTDRAMLLMSIFDRIQPSQSTDETDPRYELHRHAGRHIDASHAISAGYLLVLARSPSNSPLPFPMRVAEIERVGGEGVTYWQFLIPIQRDRIGPEPKPPTTRPATRSATRPATPPEDDVER
jgi:hypothetical protein